MAFGDALKKNISRLTFADTSKSSPNAFWMVLRGIAVEDILGVYPNKVDSDIAVEVYYSILSSNITSIPPYFRVKLKSNNQERFRVINRNMWTSNAFHPDGLANQEQVQAKKEINPSRKGSKIIYQGVGKYASK